MYAYLSYNTMFNRVLPEILDNTHVHTLERYLTLVRRGLTRLREVRGVQQQLLRVGGETLVDDEEYVHDYDISLVEVFMISLRDAVYSQKLTLTPTRGIAARLSPDENQRLRQIKACFIQIPDDEQWVVSILSAMDNWEDEILPH